MVFLGDIQQDKKLSWLLFSQFLIVLYFSSFKLIVIMFKLCFFMFLCAFYFLDCSWTCNVEDSIVFFLYYCLVLLLFTIASCHSLSSCNVIVLCHFSTSHTTFILHYVLTLLSPFLVPLFCTRYLHLSFLDVATIYHCFLFVFVVMLSISLLPIPLLYKYLS